MQCQNLPALNRCQRNVISEHRIRTLVVTNGTVCTLGTTHWLEGCNRFPSRKRFRNLLGIFPRPFYFPSRRRLDRFCCSCSGRDHQLSRQSWIVCSQWIVRRLMQFYAILFALLPTICSDCVEASRVLPNSFKQNRFLIQCGQKWKTDCSLHKGILAQIF